MRKVMISLFTAAFVLGFGMITVLPSSAYAAGNDKMQGAACEKITDKKQKKKCMKMEKKKAACEAKKSPEKKAKCLKALEKKKK